MTATSRIALALSLAAAVTACDGPFHHGTASIGPQGGTVSTESGVTLTVAPGAVQADTQVTITEVQPGAGAIRRIAVEPRGLVLAVPATLSIQVEDGNVKVAEIEHGPEGEVRHELEKRRHTGEVEAEVHRLGEVELEHGLACEAACGAGFECDDGVCKAHVEDDPATHDVGDDHGVDPAPAPGTTPTTCPAGMELDASDGICKAHGGGTTDPAPAPAPAPAPTTCPDGMELDASDGICKPHGGSGGSGGSGGGT